MSAMSAAQSSAYHTSGFTPDQINSLISGLVMAVLLLWGAWAISLAYKGWAKGQLDKSSMAHLIARFLILYLVVGALILS